jgi:3-hydroxyisobutyrate dehydrogenase
MSRIGFVGLGNMGGHMARNLVAAGHDVKVFDLVADLMTGIEGGEPQESAAATATDVEIFISMLPAGRHVAGLYGGDDGVVARVAPGTLLIDCSTIDPDTARNVAQLAADKGLAMLDAPVSGGTAGAQAGTLSFIVGGEKAAFDRARGVLENMGKNIFHAGASGAGQIAKICNNMLLAVHMAGTAEALALGVNNGLDPAVLSEVMKQSSGGNWSLNGFLVDLMTKDLGLAMDTAEQSRSSVPMGALAKNLYRVHQQLHDAGGLDFSSIQWLFKADIRP